MHISDFDYELPTELIAQHPLKERDASRMLVINRQSQTCIDSQFQALPDYLQAEDVLVVNNTRVFPARLRGRRLSGGAIELLLLREVENNTWEVLARPARRLKQGEQIRFENDQICGTVIEARNEGVRLIRFESDVRLDAVLDKIGETPLPPYIKRDSEMKIEDRERYQTVYASRRGAIAAPTAGLHFTPAIFEALKARDISVVEITLHVGHGTFEPVKVDNVTEHQVAAERFTISSAAEQAIKRARERGGRVVAIGTTTARALESAAAANGEIVPQSGSANLTIIPGYAFRVVDALLTNFHLPRSSLLILVSAFAGRELILRAYRHAVSHHYRFYSYGDCMLIT